MVCRSALQRTAGGFEKSAICLWPLGLVALSNILHPKGEGVDTFSNSGICRINCDDCDMF